MNHWESVKLVRILPLNQNWHSAEREDEIITIIQLLQPLWVGCCTGFEETPLLLSFLLTMCEIQTLSPQVYRNFLYRKKTKLQFARDDPAFLVLLAGWLVVSSVGFAFVLGIGFFDFIQVRTLFKIVTEVVSWQPIPLI